MLDPEIAEVRDRLRTDTPYFARHCLTILTEHRETVRLEARPWQARTAATPSHVTPLDEALESQRAAGQPQRAIILKARKLGFCLAPETRVLTADLRWVPIDSVKPGDVLMATDEDVPGGMGNKRKLRRTTVEAKREVRERALQVRLADGRTVVATGPHRFLCKRRGGTDAEWRTVETLRPGDEIRHIVSPWAKSDYEDGWFGGMIDGEGSLRGSPGGACSLAIYQRPGDVHMRAQSYLDKRGYTVREFHDDRSGRATSKPNHHPGEHLVVSRTSEMFRLVGQTRPTRFVNDASWWEGREMPKRSGSWARVEEVIPLMVERMIDLQTDRKTFIAEGLVSHNSTWVQAKMMQRVSQFPFEYALTVAHNRGAAGVLYDMASLMWERLPNDRELAGLVYGPGTERPAPFTVKPHRLNKGESRNGARWMVLGEPMRKVEASIYETLTAGAKGGGRASTPSILHGSEVAHYEDPEYLVGLLNAVPKTPESIVVLESTARGFNHFYDRWVRAVEGAEDPETGGLYVPLFYGWQDNPGNSMPFTSEEARARFERTVGDPDGGGDEEEPMLRETFGVTLEQLRWRRITISEECGGDVEFFHQEHPATPEQAFIGSGRPVFPGILVAKMLSAAEKAREPVEGVLRGVDVVVRKTRSGTIEVPQRAVWIPRDQMTSADLDRWGSLGRLAVWEHPVNADTQEGLAPDKVRPDGQYVVFADVAIGAGGTNAEGDWHAVQVLDHIERVQVARYRSRIPVHDLPILLYLIGLYYNTAWLAPEVNGPGQGVIDSLRNDLRYPLLYRRRHRGDDDRADAAAHLLGWQTTLQSKPLMEQTFGQALREGTHGLRCVLTGREATTYVEDPKNPAKHGAQKGAHDDLLMAFMGAHRIAAELRPRDPSKTRRVRGRDVVDPLTGW